MRTSEPEMSQEDKFLAGYKELVEGTGVCIEWCCCANLTAYPHDYVYDIEEQLEQLRGTL